MPFDVIICIFFMSTAVVAVKIKYEPDITKVKRDMYYYYQYMKYRNHNCVICLEPLTEYRNNLVVMNVCGHMFHENCLIRWDRYKSICPLCRVDLDV